MCNLPGNNAEQHDTFVGNAKAYAMTMVHGAKDYFKKTFLGEMKDDVAFYRKARLMNPAWAKNTNGNIREHVPPSLRPDLLSLQWFADEDIDGMVREYPKYVQAAKDSYMEAAVAGQGAFDTRLESIAAFWLEHKTNFPFLAKLVRYFYTFLPSSAMSERVFSMLKEAFNLQQLKNTLGDYVGGCVMLRFNRAFIKAYPEWREWVMA